MITLFQFFDSVVVDRLLHQPKSELESKGRSTNHELQVAVTVLKKRAQVWRTQIAVSLLSVLGMNGLTRTLHQMRIKITCPEQHAIV